MKISRIWPEGWGWGGRIGEREQGIAETKLFNHLQTGQEPPRQLESQALVRALPEPGQLERPCGHNYEYFLSEVTEAHPLDLRGLKAGKIAESKSRAT